MSGFVFSVAKKIAVKPVVAVLEASDPVIVKMGKLTTNLPDKGRAAAVSKLRRPASSTKQMRRSGCNSHREKSIQSMMRRIRTRLLLAVCLVAGALSPGRSTWAEESQVWVEKASEGFVSLAYGPLDPAKVPLLLLSCFDAMGIAVLDLHITIDGVKPGEALTIALAAGEAKAQVEGEAAFDDASSMIFAEASDIAVKPVLEVLRQPGPLAVTVGQTNATLPDQGRADAVAKFSQDCQID
jgi:hypothetical protein